MERTEKLWKTRGLTMDFYWICPGVVHRKPLFPKVSEAISDQREKSEDAMSQALGLESASAGAA